MSENKEYFNIFGIPIGSPIKYDPFECMHDDEIIFEYRLASAELDFVDYEEDDYDFSITIYRNGYLLYRKYVLGDIEVKFKKYNLKEDTVRKIYNYISESTIKDIPENLDNDSDDGSMNEFLFYNKKISALNIVDEEYQPESLEKDYAKEFGQNYYYECEVMKLFKLISGELLKSGYYLDLYSFKKKLFAGYFRSLFSLIYRGCI